MAHNLRYFSHLTFIMLPLYLAKQTLMLYQCHYYVIIVFVYNLLHFYAFLRATALYAIARICHGNSVCPSVCLSVTWVDQSKAFEVALLRLLIFSNRIAVRKRTG